MGRGIIKPKQDVDFYVEWSHNSDMPVSWGPRALLESFGIEKDRLDRADTYSTSYRDWARSRWEDDPTFIIDQSGTLHRSQMIEFCKSLDEDGDLTEASRALLEPLDWD